MNIFKSMTVGLLTGLVLLGATGCARDLPYSAPMGSEVVVNPQDLNVLPGSVILFEALVWDPEDGRALNNIQVTVKSYVPGGLILVPESAILGYNNTSDTSWQVDAAESYYELTEVNDEIQPDLLQTITDSRGMVRVYVYAKCLPMACEGIFTDTCSPTYSGDTCEGLDASIVFSIGVDTETITLSAGN